MTFTTWNANALFHTEVEHARRKWRLLQGLFGQSDFVAVQETHGEAGNTAAVSQGQLHDFIPLWSNVSQREGGIALFVSRAFLSRHFPQELPKVLAGDSAVWEVLEAGRLGHLKLRAGDLALDVFPLYLHHQDPQARARTMRRLHQAVATAGRS